MKTLFRLACVFIITAFLSALFHLDWTVTFPLLVLVGLIECVLAVAKKPLITTRIRGWFPYKTDIIILWVILISSFITEWIFYQELRFFTPMLLGGLLFHFFEER